MKTTKIFIGSDHGGFELKQKVVEYLEKEEYPIEDLGCKNNESCDYPNFGAQVGKKVVETKGSKGIVICGSGVGISIAANKVKGVRCVLANSCELAQLGREHNGANILSMGERTKYIDDPLEIVKTFLSTDIDPGERHQRRREQLDAL